MHTILGIDPGLQHTGWGVIASDGYNLKFIACGTISTNSKDSMDKRLLHLHNEISKVADIYNPSQVGIEETFVNKNPLSSLKLGHARGCLMVSIAAKGLSVAEYSATKVKKSVVGVGRADKDQITMMVKVLLPAAEIQGYDAADALAVAICHSHHMMT